MISDEMRSLGIPFLDGNMSRKVTMSCTSDLVINFVRFLYVMDWQPHLTHSLMVLMDF